MERLDYAEKVQNFIPTLDWETCPANVGTVNKNQPVLTSGFSFICYNLSY